MHDTSLLIAVKAGYGLCRDISDYAPAVQYLRGRSLFEATAKQAGMKCWGAEAEVWLRSEFPGEDVDGIGDLVTPVWDSMGELTGVRLWPVRVRPGKTKPPTRRAMKGEGSAKGKVMCNDLALAWLRGEAAPSVLVVAEGEPDFLTCAQLWPGCAVVGVVSGAWTADFGAKVPAGCRVVLRVDANSAGESYAKNIFRTLGEGVEVWRYQEPDAERPKPRDQNELLLEGCLGEGVDHLAYCARYEPAPDVVAEVAPAETGSKREEIFGDEDGWRLCRCAIWWATKWADVLVLAQAGGGTHHDKRGWATQGFICLRAAHGLRARSHRVTPAQMERVEGSARAFGDLDPRTMEASLLAAATAGAGGDEATRLNRKGRVEADAKKAAKDPMDMDGLTRQVDATPPPKKERKEKKEKKETPKPTPRPVEPDPFDDFDGEDSGEVAANEDATPAAPSTPPTDGEPKPPEYPEALVVDAWAAWSAAQVRAARVCDKGRWAVIDAANTKDMDLDEWGRICDAKPWPRLPSESEMAWRLLERLHPPGSPAPVADEGLLWTYDSKAGIWAEVSEDDACVMISAWDGAEVMEQDPDKPIQRIKIGEKTSESTYSLAQRYAKAPGFFHKAPYGFASRVGFYLVDLANNTTSLMEHGPQWKARHSINADPTKTGNKSPNLDRYLSTVHEGRADAKERVQLMGEVVFAALAGIGPKFKRAIMFQGERGTGKSQLLDILKALVPARARCVIPPQLMGEEYDCATLAGKMLNLVTDIEAGEIIKEGSIKAIVHGEDVRGRYAHGKPFIVSPRALHVFSCNFWPAAPGVSEAFWDRWTAIRFENHFRETAQDVKDIGQQIAESEMDGIVEWAIRCGEALIERGRYTTPTSTAAVMREWQAEGDSVAAWRDTDTESPAPTLPQEKWWRASDAYKTYTAWCKDNGFRGVVNSTNFGKRLKGSGVRHHRFNWGVVYALIPKSPPPEFL